MTVFSSDLNGFRFCCESWSKSCSRFRPNHGFGPSLGLGPRPCLGLVLGPGLVPGLGLDQVLI